MRRALAIVTLLMVGAPAFGARPARRAVYSPPKPRYHAIYAQGLVSIEIHDWAQVVANMTAAIREKPDEGGENIVVEKRGVVPYIPHYYLGLAYYNLAAQDSTQYAAAYKELEESERQGFIARMPAELANLREMAGHAAFYAARSVRPRFDDVEAKRPGPMTAFFDELVDRGTALVADNQQQIATLAEMKNSVAHHSDADRAARLDHDRSVLAAASARETLDRKIDAARNLVTFGARLKGKDPANAVRELQAVVDRGALVASTGSPDEMQQVAGQIEALMTRDRALFASAATGHVPPATLFDGASAFFAGDYERAIALLDSAKFDDARANAQALLFRAAARHALFVTGGEKDHALVDKAAEDVRSCRQLAPGIAPADVFSPKFRDWFAKTT